MANEVDEFLKDTKSDIPQDDPFKQDASDPLAPQEGTKDEGTNDKEDADKPLPYHKDPKLQRYIEKEVGKRIQSYKPPQADAPKGESTEDELTDTLIEIIGNDTPQKIAAVKKFRTQLGKLEEKGAERALEQIRQQSDAEAQEEAEAIEEITNAFDSLEEEYDVDLTSNTTTAKKERSDFIDFIKRIAPKDSNGDVVQYPDFSESWKLFQSQKKPANNRAKDIASRSMQRTSDSGSAPTSGKTWKDVDKMFSKLSN